MDKWYLLRNAINNKNYEEAVSLLYDISKGNSADNSVNYNMNNAGESSSTPTNLEEDPFKDFGSEVVLSDDDLPF